MLFVYKVNRQKGKKCPLVFSFAGFNKNFVNGSANSLVAHFSFSGTYFIRNNVSRD